MNMNNIEESQVLVPAPGAHYLVSGHSAGKAPLKAYFLLVFIRLHSGLDGIVMV